MKICSLYGAGFYYIPGTDTCLKVGGFLRAEINFNAGGSFNAYRSQNFDTPARDFQTTRTRAGFTLDARSQTEYGTLRSYAIIAAMQTNGGAVGGTPYSTPFSNFAFIQFAGFTMGSTASFFEFDGQGYSNFTPYVTSAQAGGGIWVGGYTAQLGNGLSASIAVEDPTTRRSSIINSTATAAYGGRRWPDVVANLRIDQAWGSAQIMGAIHDVYGLNTLATNTTASATGYAFGGGLKVNLPMLGKGDYVIVQGTYAKGATNYLFSQSGAGGAAFALSSGYPVVANTAIGVIADGVFTGAAGTSSMDLSTGYSFTGGFEHYWVSNLRTSLYGSYGKLQYSDAASLALATAVGAGAAGSANFSVYQIGSRTVWTPVTNLDLSVDVVYSKVQTAFAGSGGGAAGTFSDKGFWAGMFRAQRNFYP